MITQTPTTPDLSFVKDLQPGVAYAVLTVVALGILMFYLGPVIKARLTPTPAPDPPKQVETTAKQSAGDTLTQAMNHADEVNGPFMDYLLRQVKDAQLENERLERENRDLRDENARLRWQRGT